MSAALRHKAADITYRQANLQLYCSQHIVLTTWVASQVQPSQYIYSCPASTSLSWKSHMADTMSKHLQGWSCEGVRQGTSMQCVKWWGWGGEGEDEGWGWGCEGEGVGGYLELLQLCSNEINPVCFRCVGKSQELDEKDSLHVSDSPYQPQPHRLSLWYCTAGNFWDRELQISRFCDYLWKISPSTVSCYTVVASWTLLSSYQMKQHSLLLPPHIHTYTHTHSDATKRWRGKWPLKTNPELKGSDSHVNCTR